MKFRLPHWTGKLALSTRPAVLDFLPLEMFEFYCIQGNSLSF